MRLPDILGPVFFAPMIIFPVVLGMNRFNALKDMQLAMGIILVIWLALLWFGKGVFYHVINISTNLNVHYFEYPSSGPITPEVAKMLPHLEINLDKLDPLIILGLLVISRWLYNFIF